MKKLSVFLCAMVLVFGVVGTANASLTTIGTATYMGSDYNLIYEDDSINGGLVWLDYTNSDDTWQNQVNWASGLGSNLTVNLYAGAPTDIDLSTGWRLPVVDESQCNWPVLSRGYEGPDDEGYHDYRYGYNMVNSEMGHLWYLSLGNLAYQATNGDYEQPGWGMQYNPFFANLQEVAYWTGTATAWDQNSTWYFKMRDGYQAPHPNGSTGFFPAFAVRPATDAIVPIPSAALLLGSGLIGLVGFRKKIRKA